MSTVHQPDVPAPRLARAKLGYLYDFARCAAEMTAAWENLETHWNPILFDAFLRQARRTEGLALFFRFKEAVDASFPFLRFLHALPPEDEPSGETKTYVRDVLRYFTELGACIQDTPESDILASIAGDMPPPNRGIPGRVLIADSDSESALQLQQLLAAQGTPSTVFETFLDFYMAFLESIPAAVVLGSRLNDGNTVQLITTFKRLPETGLPVILIQDPSDLETDFLRAGKSGLTAVIHRNDVPSQLPGLLRRELETRSSRKYKVLVVEENKFMTDHLLLLLEMAGMEARATPGIRQALEILPNFRAECVVVDLDQPGVQAQAAITTLRGRRFPPERSMVFLTSNTDRDRSENAHLAGPDTFLRIDCSPRRLFFTIANQVERWERLCR